MRRIGMILLLAILPLSPAASADGTPPPSEAPLGVSALVEDAKALDGRTVLFRGEAVGDLLARGDHAWVNLSDGSAALGVWIDRSLLPDGLALGSWKGTGTVLLVSGVFHRACAEHGGDLDIHAATAVVVAEGAATERPMGKVRPWLVLLATLAAAAAGIGYRVSSRPDATASPAGRK